jgi:hypothetical protein
VPLARSEGHREELSCGDLHAKGKSGKEGPGGSFYGRRGERMGGGSGRRSREEGAPTDRVHGGVVNEGGLRRPAPAQNCRRQAAHGRHACSTRQGRRERKGPAGRLPHGAHWPVKNNSNDFKKFKIV